MADKKNDTEFNKFFEALRDLEETIAVEILRTVSKMLNIMIRILRWVNSRGNNGK